MNKQEDGVYTYMYDGRPYSFILSDEMYRRFNAGVPIEDIAKARGCSIARAKSIINKERKDAANDTMRNTIRDMVEFDKRLVKLDPVGTSAVTMAYLQPMRKFLEQLT